MREQSEQPGQPGGRDRAAPAAVPPYPERVRAALAAGGAGAGSGARGAWRSLGRAGLLRELYDLPEGRPARVRPTALRDLLSAVDSACELGTTLGICVQAASALPLLTARRSGRAVTDLAGRALAGESMLALGATDAGSAGSDLTALTTSVDLDGDTVGVTGAKRWITNATAADHAVVLARHRPGDHFTSFALVLVPLDAPGVTATPARTAFFAGAGLGDLRFDGVRLTRDHLVGSPGQGLADFARGIATERLAGGLWASALARRVLRSTATAVRRRVVRGRPLWDSDAVRLDLARAVLERERLDALCQRACLDAADRGHVDPTAAMLVKAGVADMLERVLGTCARLAGADGFADGGPQLLRAETAMFGIAGGTTETALSGIADHLADLLAAG